MERLNEQDIQRFREISIHHIIGLRDNGRRMDMACPFCGGGRRTACFSVWPDNGYKCFSCGLRGMGAIDFMKHLSEKTDFVEILEELVPYL